MSKVFNTKNITRIAIFSALSYVLYMFVKFPLPFIFPAWLDFQISDMPALLAGYMMGPIAGCIVVLVKTLLKLPFTTTAGVGELGDFLFGISFVLTSALIYKFIRSKKGAIISLIVGSICCIVVAMFVNAFILIPFFSKQFGMDAIFGMVPEFLQGMAKEDFMLYYLPLAVVPFNILRCLLSSVITFLVYKKLARFFDRIFEPQQKYLLINDKKCILKNVVTNSENDTFKLGVKLGSKLSGGEMILLTGDLGAGKTVFARGIAEGLGIKDDIVSPTFTLMNCYEGRLKLYHYDAYRLSGADEAEERGLTEFFGAKDGVCVIEWPQNIEGVIPENAINITIKYLDESKREVCIC